MSKIVLVLATLFSVGAYAATSQEEGPGDAFITCWGDHHGSYVDFYTDSTGTKIYTIVSNDGEPDVDPATGEEGSWPRYDITSVSKAGAVLKSTDYNQTLLDVVKAMKANSGLTSDYVRVDAVGPKGSQLILNMNNWHGNSYLVIDGEVEPLSCEIPAH